MRLILLVTAVLALACIGYFMVMNTLSSPTKMELYMPKDADDNVDKYSDVKTKLTLILLSDEKVFGYYGDFVDGGRSILPDETGKLKP